ncbi:M56 family metallopeptidase [Dietzia sp. ANT_WB102]|uniref:M56 family metallopeptidase n=1 Tax=Dietzia sp. ANT_WB102 TaxID=2597345 RepID=UPI0011EFFD84|nr:M56 family metallopeptidase [Dietzia sp. ANT_WB102]KAA0919217.1 M56 family metallopeptidase [Dietzia sp. ANT_WB102]
MTHGVLAALLIGGLVVTAVAGPRVLRAAAPLLMRVPRLAVGLLLAGTLAWVLSMLAVGPVLAWVLTGPVLLPSGAAQVCEKCLAAANPFGGRTVDAGVPAALLLAAPIAVTVLSLGSLGGQVRRRHRGTLRSARQFRERARRRSVAGYDVLLVEDRHPFALSLPRRHGGIVVSTGAVALLGTDELRAVLAHEDAHLRQRHHLLTALVDGLTTRLRWVPLLGAAADAFGHYLEIAADADARRVSGTPALASALLVLGQHGRPLDADDAAGHDVEGVLHALGPDRIRHLVQPGRGTAGVVATVTGVGCLLALTVLAGIVHVPYVMVVLTGCV